jgi:uncharacterized membrane-anchored protein YjiN (DUF445 family)
MNAHYLRNFALTAAALFLAAVIAPAFQESASQETSVEDSEQIAELFEQARAEAAQLETDSHELVTYQRSRLGWKSHAEQVEKIKEHVNKTGELEQQLREARESGSAWQQEAIDRINPTLKELADNLESTIDHMNANRRALWTPTFHEYVKANAELAAELHAMIADFVDYGQTKQAFQKLQTRLELEEG